MTYTPSPTRYDKMIYNRCGRSGVKLPRDIAGLSNLRLRQIRRFDARNMSAERSISASPIRPCQQLRAPARLSRACLRRHPARRLPRLSRRTRDLDQSRLSDVAGPLRRVGQPQACVLRASTWSFSDMGLDYVDIFYSHRFDPETSLRAKRWALSITRFARARPLYAGISSYNSIRTKEAATTLRRLGRLADPPAQLFDDQSLDRGRTICWTRLRWRASARPSSFSRWRKACSPISISPACRPAAAPLKIASSKRRC